jgi:hypothetical protein
MRTLGKMAALLVVLGFCLPAHGEILVYKLTQSGTFWWPEGEGWASDKGTWKGYVVVDIDYTDNTITQAMGIGYERDADGKWFEEDPLQLELVRVETGTKVQWVIVDKEAEFDGETVVSGFFLMLAGPARDRNVGTGEKQEVANTLKGYVLEGENQEGNQDLGMSSLSVTLYPAWTYWANGDGDDEGNQDFDATTQMIEDYLSGKGYTAKPQ